MFHICQLLRLVVGLPTNVGKEGPLELVEERSLELVLAETPDSVLTPVPVNTTIF